MDARRQFVWGGVVLALVLLMILSGQGFLSAAAATTSTPTPSTVLFRDDFSTYSGRWTTARSPKSRVDYANAALNMQVLSPGVGVWSVPDFDLDLDRFHIEVTVTFQGGSTDSMFGLVLSYENADNFYAILVSPEGQWRFLRRDGTAWIDLTPEAAESFEWTSDTVRLAVNATDDTFILWVNDVSVGEVRLDGALSGDLFGFVALAGEGYIDVAFDDVLLVNGIEEDD